NIYSGQSLLYISQTAEMSVFKEARPFSIYAPLACNSADPLPDIETPNTLCKR
ncbi:hypothetical protein GOODEAATRI_004712, partial [Goodea atripinnis]